MLSTQDLGGVKVTDGQFREMQAGDYILHARGRKLEKVDVEKIRFPVDPEGHVQCVSLAQAPGGTIYTAQRTIVSKSTDGGRTWEHFHHRDPSPYGAWRIRFDAEGKVKLHQDFWDSAGGLFEHTPVLGWMLQRAKKRL